MSHNKPLSHTISDTQPANRRPGDEWYNGVSNLLYKAVATNETTVEWKKILLDQQGTVYISSTTNSLSTNTGALVIEGGVGVGGNVYVGGSITDSIGNVRVIPQNLQSIPYTLLATDNGKHISANGVITVPPNVFPIGSNVMIYNSTASNLSITTGTNQGISMFLAGTATQGARTLAQRGLATLVFVTTNTIIISGAGLT